jgi:hypothetical protein
MSEAFDAADVLQFDHVDPMSHDTLRLGEVSRDSSTLLRTGGLGLALEADFGLAIETYLPPTPPAASRPTACVPTRCPWQTWANAPSPSCRTSRTRPSRRPRTQGSRSSAAFYAASVVSLFIYRACGSGRSRNEQTRSWTRRLAREPLDVL